MMGHRYAFVGFHLLACICCAFGTFKGYDLVFQSTNSDTSRALLTNEDGECIDRLASKEFTVCLFAFLETHKRLDSIDIFSFSSKENLPISEIVLEISRAEEITNLYINGARLSFETIPPFNEWAHICVAWKSKTGQADLYINGKKTMEAGTVQRGHTLGGNGYLVLGHDQDDYKCGFDSDQGIRGRISQFHFWNRFITHAEVKEVEHCQLSGNVVSWENSTWRLYGRASKEPSNSPCGQPEVGCGCNKPEIDALKNLVIRNNEELHSQLKFTQNKVSSLQRKNDQAEKNTNALKERIYVAEKEIKSLQQNSTPIGFIYIQLPGQELPAVLWPHVNWKDVSSTYAGTFFRVVGQNSAPFGQVQEGASPRLDQVSISSDQGNDDPLSIPVDGSWSSFISTGASYVSTGAFRGIRFRLSPQEVRPRNQAVKVWQRVA